MRSSFAFKLVALVAFVASPSCSSPPEDSTAPDEPNTTEAELGAAIDVWLPRPHAPRFATPASSFSIELAGAKTLSPSGFKVTVRNDLRAWSTTVTSATYKTIHNGKQGGWRLEVALPADVPPELLDVSVAHPNGGTSTVENALSVVSSFEEDFYVLHVSDQHIAGVKAVAANGSIRPSNGSQEAMGWAGRVYSVVHPRFVLVTGDNAHAYNGASSWGGLEEAKKRFALWRQGLASWRVATPSAVGNHDVGWSNYVQTQDTRKAYESVIGARAYSFRMGDFYVLSTEFTTADYLPWARADWRASFDDKSVHYRMIAMHSHAPWVEAADAAHPANIRLAGHTHETGIDNGTKPPTLTVAAAERHYPTAYVEFRRQGTTWTSPQGTSYKEGTNVFPAFGDKGAPKVRLAFGSANDGSKNKNSATIENDLPLRFRDGRVRFLAPKGTYGVTGGTTVAAYDYDATHTAIDVKVDIPASGRVVVNLAAR